MPSSIHMLIVDDDEITCNLLEEVLSKEGYLVDKASDGRQALVLAAGTAGAIDLLVTDMVMPGMSGRALAERIQRERPGMPVLYVSGHAEEAISAQGLAGPGADFLQKPFTPEALSRKVREALDRRPSAPPSG